MVKTKTSIFCQRMNIDAQHLMHLLLLLEGWNQSEDDFDELMLDAGQDLIERVNSVLSDMQSLSTSEWSALFNAQQALIKAEAKTEDVAPAADSSGMPSDGAGMPKDGACKEAE